MLLQVIKREWRRLVTRPVWLTGIVVIPLMMAIFFVGLLGEGLPLKVPAAIVDLDHTAMSRKVARSLGAMELVDITAYPESFNEAIRAIDRGEIYGFFVIPENFSKDAISGRATALTFYSNLTYYVPGTLVYKGFKTLGVTTSGSVVSTQLISKGATDRLANVVLQPMTIQNHPIGNPWLNYNYYLSTSFLPGVLQLMIFIMTMYSIASEIKHNTSRQWLCTAGNNIYTAVLGKLAPQTLLFTCVGLIINYLLFGYLHFPMNGSLWALNLGMLLLVIASQGFAVMVASLVPNLRLGLSICCLIGILTFSVAAFSFPVPAMYGAIGIFSYILPVRWYFLIYIDQALDGVALYYSRMYFVWLLTFVIAALAMLPLMRRALRNPVYVR